MEAVERSRQHVGLLLDHWSRDVSRTGRSLRGRAHCCKIFKLTSSFTHRLKMVPAAPHNAPRLELGKSSKSHGSRVTRFPLEVMRYFIYGSLLKCHSSTVVSIKKGTRVTSYNVISWSLHFEA